MTIILAHGLFGFGDLLPAPFAGYQPVHYFNQVAEHFHNHWNLEVYEPGVNPVGSVEDRARQLAKQIEDRHLADPLHIIAYSMGGLDARFLITHLRDVGQRVATLVTIGTPHAGSPVADAIVNPTDPLRAYIPSSFLKLLDEKAGALRDLTLDACEKFNANTPDAEDVTYLEIAGDAAQGSSELLLFDFAARIGQLKGPNDGVVTVNSALRPNHRHLDIWPVDHAGEIGWSLALLNPFTRNRAIAEHLERYDSIIDKIQENEIKKQKAAAGG